MNLAALQEKQLQLKKVETKEYKGVDTNDEISPEDWYAANIEKWYEQIESCTFPTIFVPLSEEEGKTIVHANDSYLKQIELSEDDREAMGKLEEKVDEAMKQFSNGCFVKLSCRSPKDATVTAPEMLFNFREAIRKRHEAGEEITENIRVIELFTQHIQLLHSRTAKDAFRWFIRSTRVADDIKMALEHNESIQVSIFLEEIVV